MYSRIYVYLESSNKQLIKKRCFNSALLYKYDVTTDSWGEGNTKLGSYRNMYAGKGRGWGEPGMYHFSWTSGSGQN
jgi:hypothetical protein